MTTPPKPTIREIEKCNCPCHKEHGDLMWREMYLHLYNCKHCKALSPQTGEGLKCKNMQLSDDICEKSAKTASKMQENANYPQTGEGEISEEMEKEFRKLDKEHGLIDEGDGTELEEKMSIVLAFLRKQLDLQEKRYEKIMDDLDLMMAIGESVDDSETAKIFKNIRAELRSKLSSKK